MHLFMGTLPFPLYLIPLFFFYNMTGLLLLDNLWFPLLKKTCIGWWWKVGCQRNYVVSVKVAFLWKIFRVIDDSMCDFIHCRLAVEPGDYLGWGDFSDNSFIICWIWIPLPKQALILLVFAANFMMTKMLLLNVFPVISINVFWIFHCGPLAGIYHLIAILLEQVKAISNEIIIYNSEVQKLKTRVLAWELSRLLSDII